MAARTPYDEPGRLAALYGLDLLDQAPNPDFDRVTRLAARLFGVPIALVSLVDADRQWFGSRVGLDATETPRCDAFCAHAVLQRDVFVVSDATLDRRFCDNPLVVGPPDIRFYAGAPITVQGGHRVGTLCIIDRLPRVFDSEEAEALRDLADVVERELRVIHMALTDQLTGLANRRAFVQAASRLVNLAERRQDPIAMLYADLDGLKLVNDGSGHAQGDELLRRTATVLQSAMRTSDVVARVGGDEFAVLMYDTDADGARAVAAHLCARLAEHNAQFHDLPELSLSIGVAEATPGEAVARLVARADRAMYEAKRAL